MTQQHSTCTDCFETLISDRILDVALEISTKAVSLMTFSGWVASVAGWYVTEIGRQPWIVQGLVSTTEVVAQHPSATLAGTLFGYVGLYIALMIAYMKALRIMAVKPAKSLEEDSNPLGTPLVGTTA